MARRVISSVSRKKSVAKKRSAPESGSSSAMRSTMRPACTAKYAPAASDAPASARSGQVGRSAVECSKAPVVRKPSAIMPARNSTVSVHGAMMKKVAAPMTYSPSASENGRKIQR